MRKILKTLLFSFILISNFMLVSCGEKKEELTGLHKEFDIIFNGIKEEVTTEFKNNMTSLEEEIKNSSQNELEAKLQLFGIEVIYEAFNQASYDVVSINDMGDKAELKIKVKGVDFFEAFQQIMTNTTEDRSNLLDEIQGLVKKVKKGKAPMIEQEMTVQIFKENDKWGIDDNTKNILMGKMFGSQKGTLFSF